MRIRELSRHGQIVLVVVIAVVLIIGTVATVLALQRNNTHSADPVAHATVTALPSPAVTPTLAPLPAGNDWPQYRSDVYGTGINAEQSITSANVAQLQQRW